MASADDPDSDQLRKFDKYELVNDAGKGRVQCKLCPSATLVDRTFTIKRHYTHTHKYRFSTARSSHKEPRKKSASSSHSGDIFKPKRIKQEVFIEDEDEEEEEDDEEELSDFVDEDNEDLPPIPQSQVFATPLEREPRVVVDPVEEMLKGLLVMFRGLRPDTQKRVVKQINTAIIDAVYSEHENLQSYMSDLHKKM